MDFHLRVVFLGAREVQVPTEKVLEDPLRWLDWIDRYRATVTWAPNFAYALLAEREVEIRARQWDLSCLRCAINGGEAIVARSARRAVELLSLHGLPAGAMRPTWGMSETASGAAYGRLTLTECTGDEPFVEVGRPIPGIAFRVVDEEQRLVPEGTIGRLQVRGPVVTAGYHRRPELNREVFTHDGWFRTGDYAMLRGGKLTLTGREADFLVIRGLNYYSHEIDGAIQAVDAQTQLLGAYMGLWMNSLRKMGAEAPEMPVPVRDDKRGAPRHQRLQRLLHRALALRVERAGRLVEQQDRRVLEHHARDRDALALATREFVGILEAALRGVGGGSGGAWAGWARASSSPPTACTPRGWPRCSAGPA